MKTSDDIKQITGALLKAQMDMQGAKKGNTNPFFKSAYADLPTVMEVCKTPLNNNGILILQPVVNDVVETYLIHASGEWMCSETRIVCKESNNPQAYGSAITYARRYGLQSMLFIPAEDDDGEGATDHNRVTKFDAFSMRIKSIKDFPTLDLAEQEISKDKTLTADEKIDLQNDIEKQKKLYAY